MSRRSRIFFTKLDHFFKQHLSPSRRNSISSDADAPPDRSAPVIPPPQPATQSPRTSGSSTSLPSAPSPVIPPQPPTLSTSPVPVSPVISPPDSPTSQPISRFVEHGALSSDPTASSPCLSDPPPPIPRTPSPPIQPIQPPTPSTSQTPTPLFISPSVSPSSQPIPRSVEHEVIVSDPIASSPFYDAPQPPPNLPLAPFTSGPTPPSPRPLSSRSPMSQSSELPSCAGSHDFNLENPQVNDFSLTGSGINKLLENSMPDAFHNSATCDPPPKCHLDTRKEYITMVTDCALGNSDHNEPIIWMRGPVGVGKTVVAQSCAEEIQLQNKLGATLFFSRSNANRDDPQRVFTSIAYQVATLCPPFRDNIDARVRNNPVLVAKSLSTQFEELLVRPLSQVDVVSSGIEGHVVIIDGLDECRGSSEQCEIIRVIAASARDRTTPFRWFITSRPEDPIIRTMRSPAVSSVSFHFELPVSRKIDHEILLYLTDEFNKVRESHGLPKSWPSEENLAIIVDRTAGFWVYVTTIVRFITDKNSLGPQEQLRIVIEFAKDVPAKAGPDNPWAEMDLFYTLIVQRVPLNTRTLVRKILLLHSVFDLLPYAIAGVLCLSEEQFRHLCASIQSVVELRGSKLEFARFHFYHTSFLDFMKDPERSKELCIYGDFLSQTRREYLDWLHQVCSRSTGPLDITFPSEPVLHRGWDRARHYQWNLSCFWNLFSVLDYPIDAQTAGSLEQLQFRMMLRLAGNGRSCIRSSKLHHVRDNLPAELRDKIFRQDKCPTPGCTNIKKVWIFGHGDNETVARYNEDDSLLLWNNQDLSPGRCFCGSWIRRG